MAPVAFAAILLLLMASRTRAARRLLTMLSHAQLGKAPAIALVFAAVAVATRGNLWAALCLFGASLWLLTRPRAMPNARPPLRSMYIEMALDRRQGRVIAGPYAGLTLAALDRARCDALYRTCLDADPAGARLLEPYLHGRFPGWGAAAQADADTGRARFTSRLTEEQAYQVLGLARGATREQIVRSHRAAMKKWHPDQGGSADLAAWANEARDVLLRRHGGYS